MFRHMALYGAVNVGDVPAVVSTPLTRDRPASRHTVVAPFPFLRPRWQVHSCSLFPSWLGPRIGLAFLLPPSKAPLHHTFAVSSFHTDILLSLGTLSMPHHGQLGFCSPFRAIGICIQLVCSFFISLHFLSIRIPVPPSYKLILNLLCAAVYGAPLFHPSLFCASNRGSLWHWMQIALWWVVHFQAHTIFFF